MLSPSANALLQITAMFGVLVGLALPVRAGEADNPFDASKEAQKAAEEDRKRRAAEEEEEDPAKPKLPDSKKRSEEKVAKVPDGGVNPKAPVKPPDPPKPVLPPYVKGQPSDLFGGGRASTIREEERPTKVGNEVKNVNTKVAIFDGWGWESNKADGFSVSGGICAFETFGILTLAVLKEANYELTCEVNCGKESAVGVLTGEGKGSFPAVLVNEQNVLYPGMMERNNQGGYKLDLSEADKKLAKKVTASNGWVKLRILVTQGSIQVFQDTQNVLKYTPPKPPEFARLSLSAFGMNNNKNPTGKVRNAILRTY